MRIIGGAVPSVVYTDTKLASGTATTFTFTGVNLGTPKTRRRIVVATASLGSTPLGLTIDGVAMTSVSAFTPLTFYKDWPSGSTATMVFTQSLSTSSFVSITVWALYDLGQSGPYDVATSTSATADLSLDVPARGVVTALAAYGNNATSYTWSGLTQDYQQTSSGSNIARSGASIVSVAGGSPLSITCTMTGSPRSSAVSWR